MFGVEIPEGWIRRELPTSLTTTPVHALLLFGVIWLGALRPGAETLASIVTTFLATFVWTEIWHYFSHVAMCNRAPLFSHREYHLSKITNPWTSISFSFLERSLFTLGISGFMSVPSHLVTVSVYGIAVYCMLYFVTNTLGNASFESHSAGYADTMLGRIFSSPADHARYDYSLMTPSLGRWLGTSWPDAAEVQARARQGNGADSVSGAGSKMLIERNTARDPGRGRDVLVSAGLATV